MSVTEIKQAKIQMETVSDVKDTQSTHSRKNRLLLAIISHFTKKRMYQIHPND